MGKVIDLMGETFGKLLVVGRDDCTNKYGAKTEYPLMLNIQGNHWLYSDIFIEHMKTYIEIHGEQHYIFTKYFHETIENFEHCKKLDRMKRKRCRKNGIYIEVDLRKIKTIEQAIEYVESKIPLTLDF